MTQAEFRDDMLAQIRQLRQQVQEHYYFLEGETLNMIPADGGWSMLQCFEHINLATEKYLQKLNQALEGSDAGDYSSQRYRMGFFGKRLAESQRPKNGRIRWKTRTFPFLVPINVKDKNARLVERVVFEKFNEDLDTLEQILHKSNNLNWKKTRITTLAGRGFKLRFGDAVAFVLAHTERHIEQADKIRRTL